MVQALLMSCATHLATHVTEAPTWWHHHPRPQRNKAPETTKKHTIAVQKLQMDNVSFLSPFPAAVTNERSILNSHKKAS